MKRNRIKEELIKTGRKQTWLAQQLGKSFAIVNEYCNNKRQPSIEVLYETASILGIEAKDLLMDKKDLKAK